MRLIVSRPDLGDVLDHRPEPRRPNLIAAGLVALAVAASALSYLLHRIADGTWGWP